MRLKKLKMTAFGSYFEQEIDFQKFGDKSVFIINGKTGAGKTLIFDAIVYALYGSPSGFDRKAEILRNNSAEREQKTEVELTFSENGETYTVTRRMEPSGGKKADIQHSAELIKGDRLIAEKTDAVSAAITAILGIDKVQFTQIVMIAQGDFQRFLFSDTKQKQEIFRSLFNTEIFEKMKDALSSEVGGLRRKNEEISGQIVAELRHISFGEGFSENEALSEIKGRKAIIASDKDGINSLIEAGIAFEMENRAAVSKEYSAEEKAIGELSLRLGEAETINGYISALKQTETTLSENEPRVEEWQLTLDEAEKALSEKDSLNGEIGAEMLRLPLYDEIMRLEGELSAKLRAKNELSLKLDTVKATISEKREAMLLRKSEAEQLQEIAAELDRARLSLERENARIQKYADIISADNDLQSAEKAFAEAKAEYSTARGAAELATAEYERNNLLFLDEQAGVLAERLSDGAPCPVCGSENHPHPAHKSEFAPSEQELKTLLKKSNEAKKEAELKSSLSAAAGERHKQLTERLSVLAGEMYPEAAVGEAVAFAEKDKAISERTAVELQKTVEAAETAAKQLQKLNAALASAEMETAALTEQAEAFERDLSVAKEEFDRRDAAVKAKRESVGGVSRDELEAGIERRRARIAQIDSAYKRAKDGFETAKQLCERARTEINMLKANIGEKTYTDTKALNAEMDGMNARKDELFELLSSSSARLGADEAALPTLLTLFGALSENENNLSLKDGLFRLISGTEGGNAKITLEAYAQSVYFKSIIAEANKILFDLSNGRYSLLYREKARDNRSKAGLDLEISDSNEAKPRDIKTLSGGETFLASLSLALGLSVFVQSLSGGRRLETMFIDEGFGTLDSDTLKTAIDALLKLSESGGKLIGLISHITEIHDRIDNRINVINSNGVSRAEISVG